MKTALLTILTMTSFYGVAVAADKSVDKSTDVNSGTFAVEKVICNKSYVPANGVQSPEYRAGIDVNGNAVAPADVAPLANAAPDYVEVPMTIDLAKRMGVAPAGAEMEMPVANLKLYKNGKVEYNGQDISSNAATLCGVADKSDASAVQKVEPAAGQEQMITAPAETVVDNSRNYQSDTVAPDNVEPQAGSVAASTTSPPPKIVYQLQRSTVNMAPRTGQ